MSCEIESAGSEPEIEVDTKPETELQPPDGGWGWAVCFAAFMANFTVAGVDASNGLILLGLLEIFNEPVSKTSLVGSFISGTEMFGGPLVLVLLTCKASYRQIMMFGGIVASASAVASTFAPSIEILIFTYGILAGLSLAISYFSANVILGCYFNKRRALALGIANSGSGIGSFIMSYVIERVLSFYGTRGTHLIIAGVFLNMTVYGSLCRPLKPVIKSNHNISESRRNSEDEKDAVTNIGFTPEDEKTETQVEKNTTSDRHRVERIEMAPELLQTRKMSVLKSSYCDTTVFRNKTFGLLLAIFFLWSVGYSLLLYVPLYAESVGLSRGEAAMIISFYGIFSTLGQIFVGFLADVIHIPISYLLLASLFGMSLSIASMSFCQTFATLSLSMVVFAISYSSGITLRIVILAAVLGIEKLSEAYSIMAILIGIGYIIFPIITGIVYDATHSFPTIFYMDSAVAFLGAIFSCGFIYLQKKENSSNK